MEQIYTIPVNEAFDRNINENRCDCPLCMMYNTLEMKELDLILGPSMMEPDIRIQTNEKGFCKAHFSRLLKMSNRLPFALILESHLNSLKEKIKGNPVQDLFLGKGRSSSKKVSKVSESCFICDRKNTHFENMVKTVLLLYKNSPKFKEKYRKQPYFCLEHYLKLVEYASETYDKKLFSEFYDTTFEIVDGYLDKISKDVTWFCKKFDYRYEDEPWYDSKDAPERTFRFLCGSDSDNK